MTSKVEEAQKLFDKMEAPAQMRAVVMLALLAWRTLPAGQYDDLLKEGIKFTNHLFAVQLLAELWELPDDHLRPGLHGTLDRLVDNSEAIMQRFCNLLELFEDQRK